MVGTLHRRRQWREKRPVSRREGEGCSVQCSAQRWFGCSRPCRPGASEPACQFPHNGRCACVQSVSPAWRATPAPAPHCPLPVARCPLLPAPTALPTALRCQGACPLVFTARSPATKQLLHCLSAPCHSPPRPTLLLSARGRGRRAKGALCRLTASMPAAHCSLPPQR